MSDKYILPALPYAYDALEPHVDAQTMQLHHDKHHQGYVDGANKAQQELAASRDSGDYALIDYWEKKLAFHTSGHALHSVFWPNLAPPDRVGKPSRQLRKAIEDAFGNADKFKAQLSAAATTVEGNGWGILGYNPLNESLVVLQCENHQKQGIWWFSHCRTTRYPASGGSRIAGRPEAGYLGDRTSLGRRRVGARLLPSIPEPASRLHQGLVERGQLGRRFAALLRSSSRVQVSLARFRPSDRRTRVDGLSAPTPTRHVVLARVEHASATTSPSLAWVEPSKPWQTSLQVSDEFTVVVRANARQLVSAAGGLLGSACSSLASAV